MKNDPLKHAKKAKVKPEVPSKAKEIANKTGINIHSLMSKMMPGESMNIEKMEGGHIVSHHKKDTGKAYHPPKKYIIPGK